MKLNPAVAGAAGLLYGTFLGGAFSGSGAGGGGTDTGYAVAVDAAGVAYLTGETAGANFPTVNAFQSTFGGGANDVFVAKLNPAVAGAAGLLYASFLGGADPTTDSYSEAGRAIAVDGAGNAYVAGWTNAPNFPVTGGRYSADPDPTYTDVFVAKVNTTANGAAGLVYSTYLGGNNRLCLRGRRRRRRRRLRHRLRLRHLPDHADRLRPHLARRRRLRLQDQPGQRRRGRPALLDLPRHRRGLGDRGRRPEGGLRHRPRPSAPPSRPARTGTTGRTRAGMPSRSSC